MSFHDVTPDGKSFAFDLTGSVSGAEGSGKAGSDFVSTSGDMSIKADDFGWDGKTRPSKPFPAQFAIEWDVYSMSQDTWRAPAGLPRGSVPQDTVIRCWKDGPHVLEIIPNGDGPIGLKELTIFSPAGLN
jgi:hypothetical protein